MGSGRMSCLVRCKAPKCMELVLANSPKDEKICSYCSAKYEKHARYNKLLVRVAKKRASQKSQDQLAYERAEDFSF